MWSLDEILAIYRAGPEAMVALVEKLWATQVTLEQQVQVLAARVAELEARLNKDSHNSHHPPSSHGDPEAAPGSDRASSGAEGLPRLSDGDGGGVPPGSGATSAIRPARESRRRLFAD